MLHILRRLFWTCHVDTVIDVSGVSALSQITSFALIGELIFAFANISSAEHKQHTKQNSCEIQVLL